ncbi:MAG TPA: flagellar hook-basal body complex protein [bacterium]|nr:flagellar hook-basal body complex protein [bacterium]
MGLRDMFSAISGLQANSTWLDVIGNNISNSNTVAYKASRVEFADQFSQTLYGGTGGNQSSGLGGVNPEQIGLGTRVASITTLFTEGALQNTGRSTDIAIVGNGFLVSKSGTATYLTRAGNLGFDSNGNLVDQNGGLIQGLSATVQYTTKTILTAGASGNANALLITSAKLGFTTTSAAAATNIQIPRDMTMPPNATTVINFAGNLDSFLQATDSAHGGILDIGGNAVPAGAGAPPEALPLADATVVLNNTVFNKIADPNNALGQVIQQVADANVNGVVGNADIAAKGNVATANPNVWGAAMIANTPAQTALTIRVDAFNGNANFAWDQQPPVNPAHQIVEQVFDSEGNPRQVTINMYQVNDLGNGGVNNAAGPNQVAYAWYAFDTTGGAQPSSTNIVGGTGLQEGDVNGVPYDRGVAGDEFYGDLLVFNTDGSLLSTGGAENVTVNGQPVQAIPNIYLPPMNNPGAPAVPGNPPDPANGMGGPASPIPTQGAEITQISLDFGTAGVLGQGKRDGVYSDAEGSYQIVNGVNTYIPKSTAYGKSQDGFASGILSSLNFDATGYINGTFSNGQTTAIGRVILAMPNNQEGLSKVGSNYYQTSSNTGALFVGFADQDGVGTIQGGTLELSNVDLTVELTNMIIAQRGFDVNSRVISVENSNLQILSQLGQGG